MATQSEKFNPTTIKWRNYLPFTHWLVNYDSRHLSGDVIAGIIVAIMLVPQSMAYALIAGLPAQVGLYASIVPLVIYGLLGTSRTLAVGPVAMVSLLVASGISQFAEPGSSEYISYAITLAIMVAVIQVGLGIFRAGFLANFLSHPVLVGFTTAAAIIIGTSQIKHIMGVSIPRSEHLDETIGSLIGEIGNINQTTVILGALGISILLMFKYRAHVILARLQLPASLAFPISRSGPLVIVVIGVLSVTLFDLDVSQSVAIVGDVPSGLPQLMQPSFDLDMWQRLLPTAIAISLVGYMESIAIAHSLASKKRQKVHSNQELIALGMANVGSALTGGYPVAGGLSRSMVNDTAGANTGLASIITAGLIAITLVFLTPLFYALPQAMLAAIILVAVINLIDIRAFIETWHYSRVEGLTMITTFMAVLVLGIEQGIIVGAVTAMGFYLWHTSKPHIAVVGRIENTEHYRNVLRHNVETINGIIALRIDESLYFPNTQYLGEKLLNIVAEYHDVKHLILICSAINFVDSSALHFLETLVDELHDSSVQLSLAEVKGPVMDRLKHSGLINKIGQEHIFLSAHRAVTTLSSECNVAPR